MALALSPGCCYGEQRNLRAQHAPQRLAGYCHSRAAGSCASNFFFPAVTRHAQAAIRRDVGRPRHRYFRCLVWPTESATT